MIVMEDLAIHELGAAGHKKLCSITREIRAASSALAWLAALSGRKMAVQV